MKRIVILILFVVLLITIAFGAEKPLGVEQFTSVSELAKTISSYFPKVQGEVKAVQGDLLTVALGAKDGLKSGVSLTLWRDGKEILHPVTGAVIGRAEEEVGEMEVISVGETASTARIIKKMKNPKPGDKARITPKKISIALIPLRADRPEIIQELTERLNELGRLSVLENEKVSAFLKDRKQRDSSLIKEMGGAFGLDMVAAIEIYPSEKGKLLVTTRMFYTDDARPLDTITAMLDLTSKKEAFGEIKPFFAPVAPAKEGRSVTGEKQSISATLPVDVQLLAVADLDGTGALKYVVSGGSKIHIYRQESSGWLEEWSESLVGEIQQINLDVADINGNGRPEIFVTAMRDGKVISSVIEFQEGTYRHIAEVPGFLRVITYPHKQHILIGQSYDPKSFFAGKPRQYMWSDGKYVPGEEFPLPKGLGLYGFMIADMGESKPFLVALNDKDQLVVYSKNNAIWKSEEKYPAIGLAIIKPLTGPDAVFLKDAAAQAEKMGNPPIVLGRDKAKIQGRVLALDINGNGREEIILPKNLGDTLISGYKEAEFVSLSWTGSRLERNLNIPDIPGVVLDFQIIRQQGSSTQIFALVNSFGGIFKSDSIRVLSYAVK